MIKKFKELIMHGDVLGLVVGVVIGNAFVGIVSQVVQGLITPLIGWLAVMVTGVSDLEGALSILDWPPTKGITFVFGSVISVIITLLITGFVLFLVVKVANRTKNLHSKGGQAEVGETPIARDYLSDIRDLLAKQVTEDNIHPVGQIDPSGTSK